MDRKGGTVLEGHFNGLDSLGHLKELIKKQRIREAARVFISRSAEDGTVSFGLNRQAAFAGRISFYRAREAPLGPIQIMIRGDVEKIVEFLCDSETAFRAQRDSRR